MLRHPGGVYQLPSEGGSSPIGSHMFAVDAGFGRNRDQLLRISNSRRQEVSDLVGALHVAGVASLQFANPPPAGASFLGKRLEERPPRVSFRDTTHENGRNVSLPIVGKTNRVLEAAQTEIT